METFYFDVVKPQIRPKFAGMAFDMIFQKPFKCETVDTEAPFTLRRMHAAWAIARVGEVINTYYAAHWSFSKHNAKAEFFNPRGH